MKALAQRMATIISDYHCDVENNFEMTPEHILDWVNQFNQEDRGFILTELVYLVNYQ